MPLKFRYDKKILDPVNVCAAASEMDKTDSTAVFCDLVKAVSLGSPV